MANQRNSAIDIVNNRELEAIYDKDKREKEIQLLNKENEVKRLEISKQNQLKNRVSRLADIDSDLDKERRKQGGEKATTIIGRGKEHHHLTKISDSAKEFKGLTPEQRKEKREKDAKAGKFHGSDPRNLAQTDGPKGGTGVPHRGEGGYHSRQRAVGKGGSIQDFGSEAEIVAVKRKAQNQGRTSTSKPKPRDTGAAQRMSAAYDKGVGRSFEN